MLGAEHLSIFQGVCDLENEPRSSLRSNGEIRIPIARQGGESTLAVPDAETIVRLERTTNVVGRDEWTADPCESFSKHQCLPDEEYHLGQNVNVARSYLLHATAERNSHKAVKRARKALSEFGRKTAAGWPPVPHQLPKVEDPVTAGSPILGCAASSRQRFHQYEKS